MFISACLPKPQLIEPQFQKVLALSTGPSWRSRGLLAASSYTNISISTPPQAPHSPEAITAFQTLGPASSQHPFPGATKAWLAHLDIIRHTITSNLSTVLILEDDADWDISIKTQMRNFATAIRTLTSTPDSETAPYGSDWDILWLGHCGEEYKTSFPSISYDDEHSISKSEYTGWAKQYLADLPETQRTVYPSSNPVCTFAYALSAEGARKALAFSDHAESEAFDIRLMWGCKTRALKCISVVPELFHSYFPAERFGVKSEVDVGNGESGKVAEEVFEGEMGNTENILESARCWALWGRGCKRERSEGALD